MGSGRARAALGSAGHRPRAESIWKGSSLLNKAAQDDLRVLILFMGACLDCACRMLQLLSLFSVPGLWSQKPLCGTLDGNTDMNLGALMLSDTEF
ncbi:probable G-protein coupled receptor 63 isoform X2 [Dromaius novaehollandiae]|uniref:probable G-protein coupled receptor 63 isoform X2 n=1 Tax=Dromaius novaehollandiae TaxID=8790 RepID=UPI00311F6896